MIILQEGREHMNQLVCRGINMINNSIAYN